MGLFNLSKLPSGRITFKCNQGEEVKKTVSLAIQKSKPQKIFMSSSGIDESGQKVSEFEFEWTILVKKWKNESKFYK